MDGPATLVDVADGKTLAVTTRERERAERQKRLMEASGTFAPGGVRSLYHKDAPSTALVHSPMEDTFVLRAGRGDFEDTIRRLARGQVCVRMRCPNPCTQERPPFASHHRDRCDRLLRAAWLAQLDSGTAAGRGYCPLCIGITAATRNTACSPQLLNCCVPVCRAVCRTST